MTAFSYSSLNKTATDLITKFGQSVTFSRFNLNAYSPSAGFNSEGSATTYSANIVLFNQDKSEEAETSVQRQEFDASMSSTTAPKIGDTATINSSKYRIVEITPIQPGSTVVYYELRLAS